MIERIAHFSDEADATVLRTTSMIEDMQKALNERKIELKLLIEQRNQLDNQIALKELDIKGYNSMIHSELGEQRSAHEQLKQFEIILGKDPKKKNKTTPNACPPSLGMDLVDQAHNNH